MDVVAEGAPNEGTFEVAGAPKVNVLLDGAPNASEVVLAVALNEGNEVAGAAVPNAGNAVLVGAPKPLPAVAAPNDGKVVVGAPNEGRPVFVVGAPNDGTDVLLGTPKDGNGAAAGAAPNVGKVAADVADFE